MKGMDIDHVSGPVSCRFLIHPNQVQHVLLFGEYHGGYESQCQGFKSQDIGLFIKDIASNISGVIDFFNESLYYGKARSGEEKASGTRSGVIKQAFEDCWRNIRGCPNLRFHHINIRGAKFYRQILNLYYLFREIIDGVRQNPEYLKDIPRDVLKKYQDNVGFPAFHDRYRKWLKIAPGFINRELKEFNPLFDDKIRQRISALIEEEPYIEFPDYRLLINRIRMINSRTFQEWSAEPNKLIKHLEYFRSIALKMIKFHSGQQDHYTLARMFHRYTLPPHYAANVVFYGGDAHVQRLHILFKEFGYIDLSPPEEKLGKQCTLTPPKYVLTHYFGNGETYLIVRDDKSKPVSRYLINRPWSGIKDLPLERSLLLVNDRALFHRLRKGGLNPLLLSPDIVVVGHPSILSVSQEIKARYVTFIDREDPAWISLIGFMKGPVYFDDEELYNYVQQQYPDRDLRYIHYQEIAL
jgi:hypothetical protein